MNSVGIHKDMEKRLQQYENLLWATLCWHRSRRSNEMTSLSILLSAVCGIFFLHNHLRVLTRAWSYNNCLNVRDVWTTSVRAFWRCFVEVFMPLIVITFWKLKKWVLNLKKKNGKFKINLANIWSIKLWREKLTHHSLKYIIRRAATPLRSTSLASGSTIFNF